MATTRAWVALAALLAIGLYGASFFGGAALASRTITRVKHVEKTWGKPDATVPGAQVNQNLAGLKCDVFQARKTVVCHP